VNVGLLHNRREGLLGHPARLQEPREVGALTQLWDAQLDGAGACLPGSIATAVALGEAFGGLLAVEVKCPAGPLIENSPECQPMFDKQGSTYSVWRRHCTLGHTLTRKANLPVALAGGMALAGGYGSAVVARFARRRLALDNDHVRVTIMCGR
jgi:hypothetical protein